MSYEEYVQRFTQLKELQAGGTGGGDSVSGDAKALVPAGGSSAGKENAAAAVGGGGEGEGAGAVDGGGGGGGAGTASAPPNVLMMSEDEYVAHCQRCVACSWFRLLAFLLS